MHAVSVLVLHLLSNQGQIPDPGRREEETEVQLLQEGHPCTHKEVPRECRGRTPTLIKHHHPAKTVSDGLGGESEAANEGQRYHT